MTLLRSLILYHICQQVRDTTVFQGIRQCLVSTVAAPLTIHLSWHPMDLCIKPLGHSPGQRRKKFRKAAIPRLTALTSDANSSSGCSTVVMIASSKSRRRSAAP